jgi:antitoxin component of MazEF toxin-antitoxin module
MRAWQKLFKHGNTTGVVIPRQMLVKKGWLSGERVIVEELEENAFLLRKPTIADAEDLIAPLVTRGASVSSTR